MFNFIRNNFVRLYHYSCHSVPVCTNKRPIKIGDFCVAIVILKMEEHKQHVQHITPYYFEKGKNAKLLATQYKVCAVCGEGAVTD